MNEYTYEHFMNTFMNTFPQDMNTMNTFWLYNPLFENIRYYPEYTILRKRVYLLKAFIVFTNRFKVFIILFTKHSLKYAWEPFECL